MTPDFDPTAFLSSLENRHQTLEDLRTELQTRSQELNKELLDLVHDNYQDFLSLGGSLRGGEDKIEEVRLALLGFRRDVGGIRSKLETRRMEVTALIGQRRDVRKETQLGRTVLTIHDGLQRLEDNLMLSRDMGDDVNGVLDSEPSEFSDEDDEDEVESGDSVIRKLQRCIETHVAIRQSLRGIRKDHPLKAGMSVRLGRIQEALVLDLTNIMKQMRDGTVDARGRLDLAVLRLNIIDSDQANSS